MYRFAILMILGLLVIVIGSLAGCSTIEVDVGPLSITDSEIVAGQTFTVETYATNLGENDGIFTASIRLDERVVENRKVSIAAGATEIIRFDCIAETPGTHTLKLEDSTVMFTALKPADFTVTFISIPTEAYTRGTIAIEANVTNTGEVEGIYTPRLMVNGAETVGSDITIAPGATETVSINVTIDHPGTYEISLDGATSTLTVSFAFPDSNLEAAVREAINKPEGPIYVSDLELLTTLVAQDRDISDLGGLEYCVNLQELQVERNNISDLSPLAGLTNLQALGLAHNSISDLSPLAGLTNLHDLWLGGNKISDLSPLAGLTNLMRLWLHDNIINGVAPLAGLKSLQTLNLNGNNIADISPLAGLANLQELELSDNNISDVSTLVENSVLSAGDYLALANNPLSSSSVNIYIPQLEAMGVEVHYPPFSDI